MDKLISSKKTSYILYIYIFSLVYIAASKVMNSLTTKKKKL